MLSRGINTTGGKEPYQISGDSSIHRYVVNGEICQIPHDYCPHCWGEWDFKLKNQVCSTCGYILGEQIKLLLDSDICPNCDEGKVSLKNLRWPRKVKTLLSGFWENLHGLVFGYFDSTFIDESCKLVGA